MKISLHLHKNRKSYKCSQKKYLYFESFHFLKCTINTNIWKMKCTPIDYIIDSNDTCFFSLFENCLQYRIWYFLSKEVDLLDLFGFFRLFTKSEKNTLKNFAYLVSHAKILSPSRGLTISEDILFNQKPKL